MKKMDRLNSTGAGSVKWLEVDDVVKNILGPESAYLRGHQQPDKPPQFPNGPANDNDDESNQTIPPGFMDDNIFSVAGIYKG